MNQLERLHCASHSCFGNALRDLRDVDSATHARGRTKDEEIDNNLPAAATWITYAGPLLYDNAAKNNSRSSETHQPNVHYLRKFPKRFSEERWDFWEEGFEILQYHQILKQCTRDSAGETLSCMREIERLDPEPQSNKGFSVPPSGRMTVVQVQGMS